MPGVSIFLGGTVRKVEEISGWFEVGMKLIGQDHAKKSIWSPFDLVFHVIEGQEDNHYYGPDTNH